MWPRWRWPVPRVAMLPWPEGRRVAELVAECGARVPLDRLAFVVSCSSSSAAARIWGLPRVFQVAYGLRPLYVVEIVYPVFSRLAPRERLRVVLHELAHIPRSAGGGLRGHGRVFHEELRRLEALVSRCPSVRDALELLTRVPDPCRGRGWSQSSSTRRR